MTSPKQQRVLIVGAGFGGTKAALELGGDERFAVTLLAPNRDFRYYPTLYHTAVGGRRTNSSISLGKLFEGKNVNLIEGTATRLDRKAKMVTTESGISLPYDTLILALGVVTNYFGINGLKEFSYGIKSPEEALRLKQHIHQQLIDDRQPDMNYVIVGAGPTGIELAGALPHYLRHVIEQHGLSIKNRKIHVDLVEAAPQLLPRLPKDTARMVKRQLKRLGIKLYVNSMVQGETIDELLINGKPLRSHTVIWTAGVTNNSFFSTNEFVLTKRGKVAVDTYLQAEDNIFVIGDNANTPYSGLAQTAIHDAAFVANNLKRRANGHDFKSYKAKKPITVIPAGRYWAAVVWGNVRLYGLLGWALREGADLIGFHDYEPWNKAFDQWFTEFGSEEDCPVCTAATID